MKQWKHWFNLTSLLWAKGYPRCPINIAKGLRVRTNIISTNGIDLNSWNWGLPIVGGQQHGFYKSVSKRIIPINVGIGAMIDRFIITKPMLLFGATAARIRYFLRGLIRIWHSWLGFNRIHHRSFINIRFGSPSITWVITTSYSEALFPVRIINLISRWLQKVRTS